MHRASRAVATLFFAVACSSSEDGATHASTDAGSSDGEAGVTQGGTGGGVACEAGNCAGCDTCASWCQCLAPADYEACLSSCQGGNSGGSAGSGGVAGSSGGAAGSGGSGGVGSVGSVSCNGQSCSLTLGQECCVSAWVPPQFQCQNLGKSCAGTRVRCDGPEDCFGQVCCAIPNSAGDAIKQLLCRDTCGPMERRVCTSAPNSCPNGQQCQPSALLPSQSVCG